MSLCRDNSRPKPSVECQRQAVLMCSPQQTVGKVNALASQIRHGAMHQLLVHARSQLCITPKTKPSTMNSSLPAPVYICIPLHSMLCCASILHVGMTEKPARQNLAASTDRPSKAAPLHANLNPNSWAFAGQMLQSLQGTSSTQCGLPAWVGSCAGTRQAISISAVYMRLANTWTIQQHCTLPRVPDPAYGL